MYPRTAHTPRYVTAGVPAHPPQPLGGERARGGGCFASVKDWGCAVPGAHLLVACSTRSNKSRGRQISSSRHVTSGYESTQYRHPPGPKHPYTTMVCGPSVTPDILCRAIVHGFHLLCFPSSLRPPAADCFRAPSYAALVVACPCAHGMYPVRM